MTRLPSDHLLSPELRSLIESRCIQFERALSANLSPKMEDYFDGVSTIAHPYLLRELLAVETRHRRESLGTRLTEQQLIEAHPGLSADLVRAFRELRAVGTDRGARNDPTSAFQRDAVEVPRTIDHTPSGTESRGLHIRCPHCSNRVELVADTPYEEISCASCGSMFSLVNREETTQMAAPLKTIDRFDLVARLGVGGFGTVWKARDRDLDRVVAVKIPRRGQLSPDEIGQFFREARSAAQLRHPNIVPVHEVGREGDTLFIVSDFVRGVTLSDWLTGNRPNAHEVVELCVPIADALHHAHQQGVIHRDLKPSNIMLDESGRPYLMDFGLAKREVGEVTMTIEGQILGTPKYMSPEQAGGHGHWTDRRTDIYSLGIILFELLTGESPFRGNAQMQIHQRLTEDAPDPRKLNRHIPRDLSTICLKCLEREPGRRFASAGELGDELKRFLRGEPIQARPISAAARLGRWAKRKPMVATTLALTMFLAIAGPLAAALIERQRGRLADLVVEKNNLIDKYASETRKAASRISALGNRLDLWEGRTNPWEFWPPKREEAPRQQVVADLLKHSSAKLAAPLRADQFSEEQTARGYLGLAMLADAAENPSDARKYFQRARDVLIALRQVNPQQPQIAQALAECHVQLARLLGKNDRDEAAAELQKACEIYRNLAMRHNADAEYQIGWLETELISATMAGFDSAQDHLARVAEINQALPLTWPSDPDGVYRLACYVTQRQPALPESPVATALSE